MRAWILAITVVAAGAVVFPATAQQKSGTQQAAPSQQTREQMHQDLDKTPATTGQATDQNQQDADKGLKTRNSGESGYVGDQEKPGSSAHPPGAGK